MGKWKMQRTSFLALWALVIFLKAAAAQPPSQPVYVYPNDGEGNVSVSPTLQWMEDPAADDYEARLYLDYLQYEQSDYENLPFANTHDLKMTDMNDDGHLDVVFTHAETADIYLATHDGSTTPSFAFRKIASGAFPTSNTQPLRLDVADMDLDGDQDILTFEGPGSFVVFTSDGATTPTFSKAFNFPVPDGWLQAADLDGQYTRDAVFASQNYIQILLNLPFVEHHYFEQIDFPGVYCVFAEDMDFDGDEDIVACSPTESEIRIYENQGGTTPTFSLAYNYINNPFRLIAPVRINPGEYPSIFYADANGEIGYIRAVDGANFIYDSPVSSGFMGGIPNMIRTGFINSDDKEDVAVSFIGFEPYLFMNQVSQGNNFNGLSLPNAWNAIAFDLGDLDGDGEMDVFLGRPVFEDYAYALNRSLIAKTVTAGNMWNVTGLNYNTRYRWQVTARNSYGETAGPLSYFYTELPPPSTPSDPFPLDGTTGVGLNPALAWARDYNAHRTEIYLWEDGQSPGGAREQVGENLYRCWTSLKPATVYHWQLVAQNDTGSTQGPIWSFTTAAANDTAPARPENLSPDSQHNVPIDQSLNWDAVSGADAYQVKMQISGIHESAFDESQAVLSGISNLTDTAVADLDGDGDEDLAALSASDGALYWLESNGVSTATALTAHTIDTGLTNLSQCLIADMNGDTYPDILARTPEAVYWYRHSGAANPTFTRETVASGLVDVIDMALTDINGDGNRDVLVALLAGPDGEVVWFANGGGLNPAFTPNMVADSLVDLKAVASADLDQDGDEDVVVSAMGEIRAYVSNGQPVVAFTEQHVSPYSADFLEIADINQDTRPDLLAGIRNMDGSFNLQMALNLSRSGIEFEDYDPNMTNLNLSDWAFMDIDRDGTPEILGLGSDQNELYIEQYNYPGSDYIYPSDYFYVISEDNYTSSQVCLEAVDLDGDGDRDPLFANQATGKILTRKAQILSRMVTTVSPTYAPVPQWDYTTDYDWFVGSQNSHGVTWSYRAGFFTQQAPPEPPAFPYPADGATGAPIENALFNWVSTNAYGCEVYIWRSTRSKGDSPTAYVNNPPAFYYEPAEGILQPDTTYHWQVTGENGAAEVEGPVWTFTTISNSDQQAPEKPTMPLPANGAYDVVNNPTLQWKACERADHYTLLLQNDNWNGSFDSGRSDFSQLVAGAAADLNSDGHEDILVLESNGDAFWLNTAHTGMEGFDKYPLFQAGYETKGMAAADWNGDNGMDVAVYSESQGTLELFLHDGGTTPTFNPGYSDSSLTSPSVLEAADLNGDTHPDLLLFDQATESLYLYLNDGQPAPGFNRITVSAGLYSIDAFATGDFNSDNALDIVLSDSRNGGALFWLENDGLASPGFTPHTVREPGTGRVLDLATGDMDQDGDVDVLAPVRNYNVILMRNQGGLGLAFVESELWAAGVGHDSVKIESCDWNQDEMLDWVFLDSAQSGVRLYMARSGYDSSVNSHYIQIYENKQAMALGDFDADGTVDLAIICDHSVAFHLNESVLEKQVLTDNQTSLSEALEDYQSVLWRVVAHNSWGDTSGDDWHFQVRQPLPDEPHSPDPAADETHVRITSQLNWIPGGYTQYSDLYLWKEGQTKPETPTLSNTYNSAYQPSQEWEPGTTYHWQVVARNERGETNGPVWTFNTISAELSPPGKPRFPNPAIGADQQPLDVSLDWGDATLADSYTVQIYSPQRPWVHSDIIPGNQSMDVQIGDLNGDGKKDVVAVEDYGNIYWYENDGATSPGLTKRLASGAGNYGPLLELADLDDDGDLDMVNILNTNELVWLKNSGTNPPVFTLQTTDSEMVNFETSLEIADVDGDDDLDILVISQDNSRLFLYENDGAANPGFTRQTLMDVSSEGDRITALHVADMDDNGSPDILIYRMNQGLWCLARQGLSPLTYNPVSTSFPYFDEFRKIQTADLNGDGVTDLVLISQDRVYAVTSAVENFPDLNNATQSHYFSGANGWDYRSLALSDIDNDGILEVIVSGRYNYIVIFGASDDLPLTYRGRYSMSVNTPGGLAAEDLDGDGRLELAYGCDINGVTGLRYSTIEMFSFQAETTESAFTPPGEFEENQFVDWQVIAKNANGSTAGDIWNFTTRIPWPEAPTTPSPADGETGIAARPTLLWAAAPGADFYKVYLWKASEEKPAFPAEVSSTLYSPQADLDFSATYHWQVVSSNRTGDVAGPVWSFTTLSAAEWRPGQPVYLSPEDNLEDAPINMTFDWEDTARADSYTFVLYNNTNVQASIQASPQNIAFASGTIQAHAKLDMNGDGLDDFVTLENPGILRVYQNENNGTNFLSFDVDTLAESRQDWAMGDLNGDDRDDILIATGSELFWYESGLTSPPFSAARTILSEMHSYKGLQILDADNDGDMDILLADNSDYALRLLKSNGAATPAFTSQQLLTLPGTAQNIAVGHLNQDNLWDFVMAFSEDIEGFNLRFAVNSGTLSNPQFALSILEENLYGNLPFQEGSTIYNTAIEDMDRDGDQDILVIDNWHTYIVENRNGHFGERVDRIAPYSENYDLETLDWDQDGRIDFLSHCYGSIALFHRNSGGGDFSFSGNPLFYQSAQNGYSAPYLAQVDGGGRPELIARYTDDFSWTSGLGWMSNALFEKVETLTASEFTLAEDLNHARAYYWRVLAENSNGVTPGPLYSFTTRDGLPGSAAHSYPQDMATSVSIQTALGWYSGAYTDTMDLYIWKEGESRPATPHGADLTSGFYRPETSFDMGTTYHWQILSRNEWGQTWSSVFTFTTKPPASSPPPSPSGPSPADGARDVALDTSFNWTANGIVDTQTVVVGNQYARFQFGQTVSASALGASRVWMEDLDGDGHLDILSASIDDDQIVWYANDGNPQPDFPTSYTISSAVEQAKYVSAADLNGDNAPDVLAVSQATDSLYWFKSDGTPMPGFTDYLISNTVESASMVHCADINGDGDLDLVAPSHDIFGVTLFLNNGGATPSFTQQDITSVGLSVQDVESADLDGDGDLDLILVSSGDNSVSWLENDGALNPLFTQHVIYSSLNQAWRVTVEDFNLDGWPDVAAVGRMGSLTWLESNGQAALSFSAKPEVTTTADDPTELRTGDVNLDGRPDLLLSTWGDNRVWWYENRLENEIVFYDHTVTPFAKGASSVFAGDVDNDGDLDLVATAETDNAVLWFENEQSIAYAEDITPPWTPSTPLQEDQAVFWRVIVSNSNGKTVGPTWRFDTISQRPETPTSPSPTHGALDVLETTSLDWADSVRADNYEVLVFSGAEESWSPLREVNSEALDVEAVAAGDLNGDGFPDLVSASRNNENLRWHRNNGGPLMAFNEEFAFSAFQNETFYGSTSLDLADLDDDGDLDILGASKNSFCWYENDGATTPSFTAQPVEMSLSSNNSLQAADMDNDGDLDMLGSSLDNSAVLWFENDGAADPAFESRVISSEVYGISQTQPVDLDQDGWMDFIYSESGYSGLYWQRNRGTVPLTFDPFQIDPDNSHHALDVGDANGDGFPDIVALVGYSSDSPRFYLHNGDRFPGFEKQTLYLTLNNYSSNQQHVQFVDFEGDGDLDILVAGLNGINFLENNGATHPQFRETVRSLERSFNVIGNTDLNLDGDIDIYGGLQYLAGPENALAWLRNDYVREKSTVSVSEKSFAEDLNFEEPYYWRVIAQNASGAAAGPLWNFTTRKAVPANPEGPEPAVGEQKVSVAVNLNWRDTLRTDSYDLYLWKSGASKPALPTGADLTESLFNPTGDLDYSSTYYWQVTAKNSTGNSPGVVWSFSTMAPPLQPPQEPYGPSPANGAQAVPVDTRLDWADANRAVSYELFLWENGQSRPGSPTATLGESYYEPPVRLDYGKAYRWAVAAVNSVGRTESPTWAFQCATSTVPEKPVNATPTDEEEDVPLRAVLSASDFVDADVGDWHAVSQWQVRSASNAPDYSILVFDSGERSDALTTITLPPGYLNYYTDYFFRVRYSDNKGLWTEWSDETGFKTVDNGVANTAPNAPSNLNPANGQDGIFIRAWLNASPFKDVDVGDSQVAARWRVRSASGDYTDPVYDSGILNPGGTAHTVPEGYLEYGTTYYWQACYCDSRGVWSGWSAETSFDTAAEGEVSVPEGLVFAPGPTSTLLHWLLSRDPRVLAYNIYRSDSQAGPWTTPINAEPIRGTEYLDENLRPEELYYYRLSAVSLSGVESVKTLPQPITIGSIRLYMLSLRGVPGQKVDQTLSIDNPNGILNQSLEIGIAYPHSMLSPMDLRHTPPTAGFLLSHNFSTAAGHLDITGTGSSLEIRGEGNILKLSYQFAEDLDFWSEDFLNFEDVLFLDHSDPPRRVSVDASQIATVLVAAPIIKGDLNGDGKVTYIDYGLVYQIIIGAIVPTETQKRAADMNGDGLINSQDMAEILNIASTSRLKPLGADSRNYRAETRDNPGEYRLRKGLPRYTETEILLPVTLENLQDVTAIEFALLYDTEKLELERAFKGSAVPNFEVFQHSEENGRIHVMTAGAEPSPKTMGEVALLKFRVKGDWDYTTLYSLQFRLSGPQGENMSRYHTLKAADILLTRWPGGGNTGVEVWTDYSLSRP